MDALKKGYNMSENHPKYLDIKEYRRFRISLQKSSPTKSTSDLTGIGVWRAAPCFVRSANKHKSIKVDKNNPLKIRLKKAQANRYIYT